MFIDKVDISVKAGNGGDGAVAFHREKYVAAGGPDGGDGGKGGNIVFVADSNLSTLLDFRYKKKYAAERGDNGRGGNSFGKDGADLVIKVPHGTVIKEKNSGRIIKDLSDFEPFIVARGGRGGWGNSHFATPTRQAPRFAKSGLRGQEFELTLELKLLADVGLIGFPNVGKSTLLSVISAARPKIANYHFTTLIPQLGVVKTGDKSFVVADIPGLIEGAHEGIGLGHDFLRHIERCRLLIHLVDVSGIEGRDAVSDFEIINGELLDFSPVLAEKPQIVAGSKADLVFDRTNADALRGEAEKKGFKYFEISGATHQGIKELLGEVERLLATLPPVTVYEPEALPVETSAERVIDITVNDGVYEIEGDWLLEVLGSVNFDDYESLQYFHKVLKNSGIYERLEKMGIEEGATVSIYGVSFEYIR